MVFIPDIPTNGLSPKEEKEGRHWDAICEGKTSRFAGVEFADRIMVAESETIRGAVLLSRLFAAALSVRGAESKLLDAYLDRVRDVVEEMEIENADE